MMSMTGFGRAEYEDEQLQIWVEIKSYNAKNMDVYIQLPSDLSSFEHLLRMEIGKIFTRGKFDVKAGLSYLNNQLLLSEGATQQLTTITQQLNSIGVQLQVSLRELQQLGLLTTPLSSQFEAPLRSTFTAAINALLTFRESEGANHKAAITQEIMTMEQKIVILEDRQLLASQMLQERLLMTLEEHRLGVGFDEHRLMEEVAYLLVKSSIKEEVVRLKSHVQAVRQLMELADPVGRRLDFLAQEMHREANTIASKSEDIMIKEASLSIKEAIDSIREQGRNIE